MGKSFEARLRSVEARLKKVETSYQKGKTKPGGGPPPIGQLYNLEQAARYLNLAVSTVQGKVYYKELTAVKVNNHLHFHRQELDMYATRHRAACAERRRFSLHHRRVNKACAGLL